LDSLDGLRAISIALVLFGHMNGTRGFPAHELHKVIGDYANLGVVVFFVISGFLITRLLVVERDKYGRISLQLFYARRVLRLLPAFLLFILFLWAAQTHSVLTLNRGDLLAAITYTVNFRIGSGWHIGHLWSLSVEEQFYAIWPAVLAFAGTRRAAIIAAGALAGSPIARYLVLQQDRFPSSVFPAVADALAVGCLLALYGDALLARPWYRRLLGSKVFLPLATVAVLVCSWSRYYVVGIVCGVSAINVLCALIIHRFVSIGDAVTKVLTIKPLTTIGVLSYSLYLWQQLFLNRHSSSAICSFPMNIAASLAAAAISYYAVERPLNGLRKRLQPGAGKSTGLEACGTRRPVRAIFSRA
jgi:peptidoglycan/LPS O-acetylase OafA/YrhL